MGAALAKSRWISMEEYLEFEMNHPRKHEYVQGEVFAMAEVSKRHGQIVMNLSLLLGAHVRGGPCKAYASDLKFQIGAAQAVYYPDFIVTCDARDREAEYIIRHPTLVVEVLSPSTEAFDRSQKLVDYQGVDSVDTYLIVAQDRMRVEQFRRRADRRWGWLILDEEDVLEIEALKFSVPVAKLYEGVQLPAAGGSEAGEGR